METEKAKRGRPRKAANAWMPPNVQSDKRGYYIDNRTTREYKLLAPPHATKSEVWAAYENLQVRENFTLNIVIDSYFKSLQYTSLRPQTQKDYAQYSIKVRAVFGAVHPDAITSPMVRTFMDKRGGEYPTAANHEKAFLSLVMSWGKERGHINIANPCTAVKKIKTESTARYVEDDEYHAFYELLGKHGYTAHQAVMEIAYQCGARQQDVLRLYRQSPPNPRKDDCYVTDKGIVMYQAKTKKVQLKEWTPRLRAAVNLALSVRASRGNVESLYVVRNRSGQRYTRDGFNSTWQRMKAEAIRQGILSQSFRFHDLKHKAISDYEGDKQNFSGHASRSMMEHYNHSVDSVATINKPLKTSSEH